MDSAARRRSPRRCKSASPSPTGATTSSTSTSSRAMPPGGPSSRDHQVESRRYGIRNIDPRMRRSPRDPGHHRRAEAFAPKAARPLDGHPGYVGLYAAVGVTKTVAEESPMKHGDWRSRDRLGRSRASRTPESEGLRRLQRTMPAAGSGPGTNSPAMASCATSTTSSCCQTRSIATSFPRATDLCPTARWPKTSSTMPSPSSRAARPSRWRRRNAPGSTPQTPNCSRPPMRQPPLEHQSGVRRGTGGLSGGEAWLRQSWPMSTAISTIAHNYINANMPLIKVGQEPEGTYLVWLDVRQGGRQDRRQEDGGRGQRQEAAADQSHDRAAGIGDRGRHGEPLVRQERLCSSWNPVRASARWARITCA